MECLKCKGEMVTIETGNNQIKTAFCSKCGWIDNSFHPHAMEELLKKVTRVGDEKVSLKSDEIDK
jgi:hypothetical protein